MEEKGQRDGTVMKSTFRSSRGPRFESRHHTMAPNCLELQFCCADALYWPLWVLHARSTWICSAKTPKHVKVKKIFKNMSGTGVRLQSAGCLPSMHDVLKPGVLVRGYPLCN